MNVAVLKVQLCEMLLPLSSFFLFLLPFFHMIACDGSHPAATSSCFVFHSRMVGLDKVV